MAEQQPLHFTNQAATKVYELIQEEDPSLKLRVFVTGGGCSGFQYGFEFVDTPGEMDMVIEKEVAQAQLAQYEEGGEQSQIDDEQDFSHTDGQGRVQFLVDPISLQYLNGAEIDYKEDVRGAQFVIRNPNAKTKCGCGSSFSA